MIHNGNYLLLEKKIQNEQYQNQFNGLILTEKSLNFNYYEPSWNWIKKFLTNDKVEDFITLKELWGDTPRKYPKFSTILKNKIDFFKTLYL